MTHAIHIKDLTHSIRDRLILEDITLSVEEGKIAGIIGKSGAGKTTLLRCLNGLERPSSGVIEMFGKNMVSLNDQSRRFFQKRIGTIFQSFNLLSRKNVFDNIAFPLELSGFPKKIMRERVLEMLNLVGLTEKAEAFPSQLSGGQCQRVAIARALSSDVALLLCDEFTSALDPETTLEILELLAKLNKSLNLTILLITHDMNVVKEICDYVFVLEQGRLVESATIADILLRPKHDVTRSLVGSLFKQDLPHHFAQKLKAQPSQNSSVMLRMIFADQVAGAPVVASIVEQFHLPVNIIAGHLDHIRTTAFGQLVVSFPYVESVYENVIKYLELRQVSTELLGYIDV